MNSWSFAQRAAVFSKNQKFFCPFTLVSTISTRLRYTDFAILQAGKQASSAAAHAILELEPGAGSGEYRSVAVRFCPT